MGKKLCGFLFALLGVVCISGSAWAAESYANIQDLYNHWSMSEWPEWVCSVTATEGSEASLTVVVNSQDASERLTAMVEDKSTMTVIVSTDAYPYQQLIRVQEEIVDKYMVNASGEPAVVAAGVGWTSINGVVTGFGESGTEFRVVVGVLAEHADEYRELFCTQYGDMVYVEASGGAFVADSSLGIRDSLMEPVALRRDWALLGVLGGCAVLLGIAAVVILSRKRKKA